MKYILIFSLLFSFVFSSSIEKKAIIYQPQEQDFIFMNWEKKLQTLSHYGFKTLILQWTKYGNHNFTQKHPQWISTLLKASKKHHIKIFFGLYADPLYFKTLENDQLNIEKYLDKLYHANIDLAKKLDKQIHDHEAFGGWYIYDELNDGTWQKKSWQQPLKRYLEKLYLSLQKLSKEKKILISTYFNGDIAPAEYVMLLNRLIPEDMVLLLQSGVGAGLITPKECSAYYKAFLEHSIHQWYPIIELFSIKNNTVKADFKRFKEQDICHTKQTNVYFSLRYFFKHNFLDHYKEIYP